MMRLFSSLYHPCCRPGLWVVWVSMIGGTYPHRSHSSLEYAWILTNDEIRCGQVRPGPWILWLAMVGGTYPHRLRLGPWISWILIGRTYPHRHRFDPWISWISMVSGTYPHRSHLDRSHLLSSQLLVLYQHCYLSGHGRSRLFVSSRLSPCLLDSSCAVASASPASVYRSSLHFGSCLRSLPVLKCHRS